MFSSENDSSPMHMIVCGTSISEALPQMDLYLVGGAKNEEFEQRRGAARVEQPCEPSEASSLRNSENGDLPVQQLSLHHL